MRVSKSTATLIAAGFCLFICGFFICNLIVPDRLFSEKENRNLQQLPVFSAEALFSGEYGRRFDRYLSDQFVGRDFFVGVKSFTERSIGKRENNGVYLLKNGALAERFVNPDLDIIAQNTEAIRAFSDSIATPVIFTLIPSPVEIKKDELPYGAPNTDQQSLIERIYHQVGGSTVDTYSMLKEHQTEPIYFNTDHHWTPLGAYYGYRAAVEVMGFPVATLGIPKLVSSDFYGTAYRKAGSYDLPPDNIEVYAFPRCTLHYFSGKWQEGLLYDERYLDQTDQYSYFLGGNQPLVKLEGEHQEQPKLLIVKDSYANCEAPYFLENFSEVHLVDLRFYRMPLSAYIKEEEIDQVLISYSLSNFSSDTNLVFLR